MNISFDLRGAHLYAGTGIGTYTKNLVQNLLNIDNQNFYNFLYCGNNPSQFKITNSNLHIISKRHSSFFEQIYIPLMLKKFTNGIFHIPQNGIGYKNLLNSNNFKTIVTIHDLIPYILPETVGKSYLKNFLKEMPYIVENSSAIITVSEYSKNEICRFFSIDRNKIFVTPLAANDYFKPLNITHCKSFIKETYKIDYDFILYLGGFSRRKNVYNLIKAYSKAYKNFNKNIKLVLIGSIREEFSILSNLINKENLHEQIVFLGYVPEEHLPIFYNASLFFTYLSKYEGFGLPPLEAMKCKKAVLTSNTTSIPEVVSDKCISVNPNNILEISKSIAELSNNSSLRANIENSSYEHSKLFSWVKCAELTKFVYDKFEQE